MIAMLKNWRGFNMPATEFHCPNGACVAIKDCLLHCPHGTRCMFLPTLRAVADSVADRGLPVASVTELLSGTREAYLKKIYDYSVDPADQLYALHGTAVHAVHEDNSENFLKEIRLFDGITCGKFDIYGGVLDEDTHTLGDYKITSSYKVMRALGIEKVNVPTGEVFKSGPRKGQQKTKKEFSQGVRHVLEWAIQLNYYRMLLEKQGLQVDNMCIQVLVRDWNTIIARNRGIEKPIYLIPIRKISDRWVKLYMEMKARYLADAVEQHKIPPICRPHERWNNRKCLNYCPVAKYCAYGKAVQENHVEVEKSASESKEVA